MNRFFIGLLAFTFLSTSVVKADNNPSTNHSATQFKTGNRNATTGLEAVFYNPAGTVFGQDGFAFEFSVLPFTQTQSVYDSEIDKTYESKTSSAFYPALNMVYKKDKFSVFGNVGITNGGGAGNYDDGLPSFERLGFGQMYGAIVGGMPGLPSNNPYDYGYNSSFKGSAYGIGGFVGTAYRFNDWLSASFALQYSYQTNHQEGSLIIDYPAAGVEVNRTEIDVDYKGSNLGFIFGLDIKPNDKLLIAQTFRYYTELELEATVNDGKDGGGMFVDGETIKSTYVPFYSLGVSYFLSEKVRLEGDMNISFYSMLELDEFDGFNMAERYNNGVDFGLGIEYQATEKLNWGAGFTYAPAKLKKEYMDEMEFDMASLWLNTGVTYKASDKIDLNLAVQAGLPTETVKKDFDSALAPGTRYYQEYKKDVAWSLGLGISYRF